jgi:hypothetical protein
MIDVMLRFLTILVGLAAVLHAQGSPSVAGTWKGVFNGQPEPQPDGSDPETVTPFTLRLEFQHGTLRGVLTVLKAPAKMSRIRKSRCDSGGCSFEVVDYGDEKTPQAWRIWVEGGKLHGMRNRGPLGILGIGGGMRLFQIEAQSVNSKKVVGIGRFSSLP